jgi:hypothetical protein|tara:strand:- start:1225 stop:1578 length:354 start_codon:yes stop_codon:yes gene_type:complete
MGLSFVTVQRMFLGSFLVSFLTWVLQSNLMDATLTFIGLSALTGIAWGLSEKDTTFEALGLNAEGVLVAFSFLASIAIFAQICIGVFDFPTTGAYVLSLCFIGTFWWTCALIQPKNN